MTTAQMPTVLGYLWKSMLAWAVLVLAVGVLVLVWPGKSVPVASALFGAYLLVSGVAEMLLVPAAQAEATAAA